MFGINRPQSAWTGIATIPIFFWELSVGLWMTFKGFRKDAPLMVEAAAEVATSDSSAAAARWPDGIATTAGAA